MSPIAATDAELENNLDAVVAEAPSAPHSKTIRPCANMRRSFESQVRGIVINGPHIDDLLVLARTGEEVEFNAIWFINELDEPVEKMSFKAPLNSIEWSVKRSSVRGVAHFLQSAITKRQYGHKLYWDTSADRFTEAEAPMWGDVENSTETVRRPLTYEAPPLSN